MSLIETSVLKVTLSQYLFKLKAYYHLLFNFVIVEIIAIFFSFFGSSVASSSLETIHFINSDIVIFFALIAIIGIGFEITTNRYSNFDFSFITNRFTSNLSNILIMITLSIISSVLVTLSGSLIKVIDYFIYGAKNIMDLGFYIAPFYLFVDFVSITTLLIFIGSIGLLFGSLCKRHKAFYLIIPMLIIFIFLLGNSDSTIRDLVVGVFHYFFSEKSLLLYTVKIVFTSFVFFAMSCLVTNRMEVDR